MQARGQGYTAELGLYKKQMPERTQQVWEASRSGLHPKACTGRCQSRKTPVARGREFRLCTAGSEELLRCVKAEGHVVSKSCNFPHVEGCWNVANTFIFRGWVGKQG